MHSVIAVYDNGHLTFPEGSAPEGRMEVVVVFPDKSEPAAARDENAGRRFVREWSGILKGCNIENWKDEKADYLKEQPREGSA